MTNSCSATATEVFAYCAVGITFVLHSIVALYILYMNYGNSTPVVPFTNPSKDLLR